MSRISQSELETPLVNALKRCTEAQQEAFTIHRLPPHKVPIRRFSTIEEVYIVAVFGSDVLYDEDVEEGFEPVQLDAEGVIPEHKCNQFELMRVLAPLEYGKQTSLRRSLPHHTVMPAERPLT